MSDELFELWNRTSVGAQNAVRSPTADALGTPYAAGDTLRANLGLPRPN
jgi:hypothetical protein